MQNCGVNRVPLDFKDQYFGCEIEMTGMSRATAAHALADLFGTRSEHSGGGYDAYRVLDSEGKEWKIVRDSSITPQIRRRSNVGYAGDTYKVELNSPKLEYREMEKLQEAVRALRRAGGMVNDSCGINALDMDRAYGDERNPIVSKSEFVLSLFEQLIGDGMVTAKEKSILGRCTEQVYLPYIRNGYKGTPPTLKDFYRLLQMQPEPEAQGLALSSELFITGTLNTFAQHTNVNTQARIIAYDIRELGEQLMPLGMLVTLDAIYNRVIQNWKKGRRTWIFCDEFYILFRYEYSANFFYKLWKRIRKYNGLVTGLTQNVDELLRSDTARLMLANSEFLVMLNQSATDREELAKLLNISDTQLGYVTNVPAGCGLIRCAGNIVPFTNSFPKNTKLYGLMTTKPDEVRKE